MNNSVKQQIVDWLINYSKNSKTNGFVIGVSGGIDSAVVSTLCAETNLPVIVISMPIQQDGDQITRADKHINFLTEKYPNVKSHTINLTNAYNTFASLMTYDKIFDLDVPESITNIKSELSIINTNKHNAVKNQDYELAAKIRDEEKKLYTSLDAEETNFKNTLGDKHNEMIETTNLALANVRSRLRMVALYAIANLNSCLVAGTGNKVEDFGIGFFTKYGDGGVDISPIGDLYKSEVYALGEQLGIIEEILSAKPTDGLWNDGRTDEDQIGTTYDLLEKCMIIQKIHGDILPNTVDTTPDFDNAWKIYQKRHHANKHKMDMPPICILTK